MKKIPLIILFFLISLDISYSQSIKIMRNDVDSNRSSFITAGYVFGFDVYLDSISQCNGVSFELNWDFPAYVQFSQWKIGDIGSKAMAYVVDKSDQNIGKLSVAAGTGLPLDQSIIPNPKVIHLEFVLLQTAINDTKVTFKFISPSASIILDSLPIIANLAAEDFSFSVHGMINVYPGDSNNDGLVDSKDFTQSLFYLGMGPLTKSVKTFKRNYASTYWTLQKALTWDVASATYADCDGNGEINMSDLLIISYNLGKSHYGSIAIPDKSQKNDNRILSGNYKIQLNNSTSQKFYSAIYTLKFKDDNVLNSFVGVDASATFGANSYTFYKIEGILLHFIVGKNDQSSIDGNITDVQTNLLFTEKNNSISEFEVIEAKAINESGDIFSLYNTTTNVFEINNFDNITNEIVMNVNIQNKELTVNTLTEYIQYLKIFDLNGNVIKSFTYSERTNIVNLGLNELPSQVYFVSVFTNSGKFLAEPIILLR
jgi:hypothetical protein